MKKKMKYGLAAFAVLVMLGISGRMDYTEEVIYTMPDSVYHQIKHELSTDGNTPTDYEIANYYVKHYNK